MSDPFQVTENGESTGNSLWEPTINTGEDVAWSVNVKNLLQTVKRGGEGSGNFGHAGRKGKIGGSAKGLVINTSLSGRDFSEITANRLSEKWHPSKETLQIICKEESITKCDKVSIVTSLLQTWTGSSGSVPHKLVIKGALEEAQINLDIDFKEGVIEWLSNNPSVETDLKNLGKIMYSDTQTWLRNKNISELELFRKSRKSTLGPFSSWSTVYSGFITTDSGISTYKALVPSTQILSLSNTGFGNVKEQEVVVLGDVETMEIRKQVKWNLK